MIAFSFDHKSLTRLDLPASDLGSALAAFSHGPYTVFRVYPGNRLLRFSGHYQRLVYSAEQMKLPFDFSEPVVRRVLFDAVQNIDFKNPRVCLLAPAATPGILVILLEPFNPPSAEEYSLGVRVGLAEHARLQPAVKDSAFAQNRDRFRGRESAVHEVLMHDAGGNILEGLSSNFFAVLNGELRTAGEGVLGGITRIIILGVAAQVLPIHYQPVRISELKMLSEAFISSTSRGVLPVVEVGGNTIGDGEPGPVTTAISRLFNAQVEAELEPILPGPAGISDTGKGSRER